MRILEVCRYVAPAYAGMILAEQGHEVVKWILPREPILELAHGDVIWDWINHGKQLEQIGQRRMEQAPGFDAILTNLRSADVQMIAQQTGATVIKLVPTATDMSFDVVAQVQAWGDFCPWLPFWIGDTAAGLWMAFKALSAPKGAACEMQHAAALAKLVECELLEVNRNRSANKTPWESKKHYGIDKKGAVVKYHQSLFREHVKDFSWKKANIPNINGRIII